MATAAPLTEYLQELFKTSPDNAVQIAIAETERQQAIAATAQAEYRAMAEVDFDEAGRIKKANLAGLYRLAQAYARSQIVPDTYRGKPDDCFIACQMAFRMKIDPFAYMQNSYVVHGRPGIEAKLAIGLLNMSGKIKGRLRYTLEGDGENRACTAFAMDEETGERVEATVSWSMAVAEGWVSKNGSKWKTMPNLMFRYRSAIFLIRMFYPEVLMGIQTTDELEDIGPTSQTLTGTAPQTLDDLTDMLSESSQPAKPEEMVPESSQEPEKPEPLDDVPPVLDLESNLKDAAERFAICNALSEVGKAENELIGGMAPDQNMDFQKRIMQMGEARRDEIRSTRGSKSTKK